VGLGLFVSFLLSSSVSAVLLIGSAGIFIAGLALWVFITESMHGPDKKILEDKNTREHMKIILLGAAVVAAITTIWGGGVKYAAKKMLNENKPESKEDKHPIVIFDNTAAADEKSELSIALDRRNLSYKNTIEIDVDWINQRSADSADQEILIPQELAVFAVEMEDAEGGRVTHEITLKPGKNAIQLQEFSAIDLSQVVRFSVRDSNTPGYSYSINITKVQFLHTNLWGEQDIAVSGIRPDVPGYDGPPLTWKSSSVSFPEGLDISDKDTMVVHYEDITPPGTVIVVHLLDGSHPALLDPDDFEAEKKPLQGWALIHSNRNVITLKDFSESGIDLSDI
jgi:hypothetical protein